MFFPLLSNQKSEDPDHKPLATGACNILQESRTCPCVAMWIDGGRVSFKQALQSQSYQLNTNPRNKLPSVQHLQTLEHPWHKRRKALGKNSGNFLASVSFVASVPDSEIEQDRRFGVAERTSCCPYFAEVCGPPFPPPHLPPCLWDFSEESARCYCSLIFQKVHTRV